MKSKARSIRFQKVREINSKPRGGESSAYWEWVRRFGKTSPEGDLRETLSANPDVLADPEPQETPDVDTRALMREAIKKAKLTKREKIVLKLVGLEGFTQEQVAAKLKITQQAVSLFLESARKKCEKSLLVISRIRGA